MTFSELFSVRRSEHTGEYHVPQDHEYNGGDDFNDADNDTGDVELARALALALRLFQPTRFVGAVRLQG